MGIGPDLGGAAGKAELFAEVLFQPIGFGKKSNAVISPDVVPKVPGFEHVLRILAQHLFGSDQP